MEILVIGGVATAIDEDFRDKMIWKILPGISFLITTIGLLYFRTSFPSDAITKSE